GREIEVVRVGDGHGPAGPARPRVDRGEAGAAGVVYPQHGTVPGRGDVVGLATDGEGSDDLVGSRVDLIYRVAEAVRYVNQVLIAGPLGIHHAGRYLGVHVHRSGPGRRWGRGSGVGLGLGGVRGRMLRR